LLNSRPPKVCVSSLGRPFCTSRSPMAADMPPGSWSKLWMGEPARLECRLWVWLGYMPRTMEVFAAAIICIVLPSTWVIVFARGLIEVAGALDAVGLGRATLFLRARLWPGATPLAEPRRFRGRDEGIEVWCSFCRWRSSRSLRAKHREHSGHSKGFSLVWERSCRLRCSNRANERWQVPQTCGRRLSVLGGIFAGALMFGVIVSAGMVSMQCRGQGRRAGPD
jgi:hypothetical protein